MEGEQTATVKGQRLVAIALRLGAVLGCVKALQNAPTLLWAIQNYQMNANSPDLVEAARQNLGWQLFFFATILVVFFGAEKLAKLICPDEEAIEFKGNPATAFVFLLQVAGIVLIFDGVANLGYNTKNLNNFVDVPGVQTALLLLPGLWFAIVHIGTGVAFVRYPVRLVAYLNRYGSH